MKEDDSSGFNEAYRAIAEEFDVELAIQFHEKFRGQQFVFPVSLYSRDYIMKCIYKEYNGKNIKELARKYGYTENWLLHKIKTMKEELKG